MRRKQIILLVASTAIFFEALDIAILNLAIPLMQKQFQLDAETVQWVQTVYVLFYGGFLVIGGKLCDTLGRKNIFLTGAGLFLCTSLGAGLSNSFIMLTAFRALQGLAAAMVMPSALSIITNTFTVPEERNRSISIFSSFAAIGSGCGLALGGIVATYLGWQWIFFINVPVISLALILAYKYIDKDVLNKHRQFPDIISSILLTVVIVLISYVVHNLPGVSKNYQRLLACTVVIVVAMYIFKRRERTRQQPLIDFSLFRSTGTITGNGITILLGAFFLSYLFLLSLVLQQNMHFSAAHAGLLLFPFSVLSFLVSRYVVPALFKKLTVLQTGILGMCLMLSGALLLMTAILFGHPMSLILLSIACVTGSGMSVCYPSLTALAIRDIPDAQQGIAAGVCTTSYFIGAGLGLSLLALGMQLVTATTTTVNHVSVLLVGCFALPGVIWLLLVRKRIQS
ncbi:MULTISPECIES: MFS transporter [Niastella]|uniref:MFS transporter n=1 Tax=Niastella soli TaxID=2821487 RepID=A0ABS3YRW2_9BACT|nr:MFS transporter [Niastella soli]MBO9200185.1 MFS transporter [Niastella soli]